MLSTTHNIELTDSFQVTFQLILPHRVTLKIIMYKANYHSSGIIGCLWLETERNKFTGENLKIFCS